MKPIHDFITTPITICSQTLSVNCQPGLRPLLEIKVAAVPSTFQSTEEIIDDFAVPIFDAATTYDLPKCSDPSLLALLETHK